MPYIVIIFTSNVFYCNFYSEREHTKDNLLEIKKKQLLVQAQDLKRMEGKFKFSQLLLSIICTLCMSWSNLISTHTQCTSYNLLYILYHPLCNIIYGHNNTKVAVPFFCNSSNYTNEHKTELSKCSSGGV